MQQEKLANKQMKVTANEAVIKDLLDKRTQVRMRFTKLLEDILGQVWGMRLLSELVFKEYKLRTDVKEINGELVDEILRVFKQINMSGNLKTDPVLNNAKIIL
jgi:hypothetical protein